MSRRPPAWLSVFRLIVLVLVLIGAMEWLQRPQPAVNADDRSVPTSLYDLTMADIDEKPVSLGQFRGKVLLIVNVASKCGFTGQYAGLQKLYEGYKAQGFEILGFPANDFLWQEPGSNAEIKSFCALSYKVTFPMFAKIGVKGEGKHPLYSYLTDPALHQTKVGEVSWNFNKFLIGRSGKVLAQFGSTTDPQSPELKAAIEGALLEIPAAGPSTPLQHGH